MGEFGHGCSDEGVVLSDVSEHLERCGVAEYGSSLKEIVGRR